MGSAICDPRNWVGLTSTELGLRKSAFILEGSHHICTLVKGSYQQVLLSTFRVWWDLSNKREEAGYNQTAPSLPSDESLLTQVLAALGFSYGKWIDFKISPKDSPLNPMTPASGSTNITKDLVEDPSSTSALLVVLGATVACSWDQSQGADDHEDIYV